MKLQLPNFEEENKIENILEEKIIRKDFEWNSKFFENMNKTSYNFANRLINSGIIVDVYLDETNKEEPVVIIEYLMNCNQDLNDTARVISEIQKGIRNKNNIAYFKIPYKIEVSERSICRRKYENRCEYYGCPILLAGYIFHMTKNLNRKVKDPNKIINNNIKEKKQETLKEIITEDLVTEHNELLNEINNNIYLPNQIKEEFCKIIRKLHNYTKFKNVIKERPNLNISLIDDTDTIHELCEGQEECLTQYIKILKYFNILEENDKIKTINFKELTEDDFLNEDNYKEKIIILKNLYLLSIKDTTEITNDRQLNISIIKTKFASFIMKNSNNKIFIICDKAVNTKNFYSRFNQLKGLFIDLKIPSLKNDEIFNIFMHKVKELKDSIKLENNFESKLKEYIEKHYPYAPYKNLEFVKYLFNSSVINTLNTNHPGLLKIEDFQEFKDNKQEGELALNELIGLDAVKNEMRNLKIYLEYTNSKNKLGDKMPKKDLHMVYLGNPGTGKTTVARMMSDILFNLGYIRYNKCLETEAKDFIASIPGATALKTNEKIQEALGGVLFIDEAYALGESEYGKECIATLIKAMEDYRDDIVIILAGYENEMGRFLEINSGFKSRIAYYFEFKDYTNEELYQMFEYHFENYGFRIENNETRARINKLCDLEKQKTSFGNGRFVRQKVDEILREHAINCIEEQDEDIKNHVILPKDIKI